MIIPLQITTNMNPNNLTDTDCFNGWPCIANNADFPSTRSTGSCRNSCCENPENSCNPEGCYCDSLCGDNGDCCYDYSSVCTNQVNGTALPPGNGTVFLPTNFTEVDLANSTFNLNSSEVIRVTSPNFPNNYNNMENILLRVVAPAGPGLMYIFFGSLDMEPCCDYVRLFTGNLDAFDESTQILHLTGNGTSGILPEQSVLPNIYVSAHRYVWLQFVTDGSVTHKGFEIYFQYLPPFDCGQSFLFQCMNGQCIERNFVCDGIVDCVDTSDESNCDLNATDSVPVSVARTTPDPGPRTTRKRDIPIGTNYLYERNRIVYSSPNYPSGYNNSEYDIHRFVAQPYYLGLVLRFTDFQTEECCDSLTMYTADDSSFDFKVEVANLRGELSNLQTFVIYQNYLSLHFVTNGAVTDRGYEVEITTFILPDCSGDDTFDCGNGICIFQNHTCDNFNHCGNFADEQYCNDCVLVPEICQNHLQYNSTFFPNKNAASKEEAESIIQELLPFIMIQCNVQMNVSMCGEIYPVCLQRGTIPKQCFSDCMSVTADCVSLFETLTNQTWPISCQGLTDVRRDSKGLCLAETNGKYKFQLHKAFPI
nr:uncharacterized protein LOC129270212 [Lytechinus pictus]